MVLAGIGNCTALQNLNLEYRKALKSLPDSESHAHLPRTDLAVPSMVHALHTECFGMYIVLQGLIWIFLSGIGNCTALQTLHLVACHALKSLPDSKSLV